MQWLVLFYLFSLVTGYGEGDASGHPTYQERANHLFVNAVRIAPTQYKTTYMAGYKIGSTTADLSQVLTSTYPAVKPVYMEPTLVAAAYNHTMDMVIHNAMQHNSFDGTPTFTRVRSFYKCGTGNQALGENIAAGNAGPLDTNNQWLCDRVGSACAPDGGPGDGHRANIMSGDFGVIGVGYAYGPGTTYSYWWTQDFGTSLCTATTNRIYAGSHLITGTTIKYIAVYYVTPAAAPNTASVFISGTQYSLSLDIGTAGQATYAYSGTAPTTCQPYYFQFTSGGTTYRYPDTGCLVTYSSGCTTSFTTTCSSASSSSSSSSSASSTAKASTASGTTSSPSSTSADSSTTSDATSSPTTLSSTVGNGVESQATRLIIGSVAFLVCVAALL